MKLSHKSFVFVGRETYIKHLVDDLSEVLKIMKDKFHNLILLLNFDT